MGILGIALLIGCIVGSAAHAQQASMEKVTVTGTGKVSEVYGSAIVVSGTNNQVKVMNDDVQQISVSGIDNVVIYSKNARPRIVDSGINTQIRQF